MIERKRMKDNIFVDSNVILYTFGKEKSKKEKAKDLVRKKPLITTQIINEVSNVLFRKFNFSVDEVRKISNFLRIKMKVELLNLQTIDLALYIKERYKYSYYDSLIIASALENACNILYTEDMQHGQIIEDSLKIINPFEESER